MTIDYPETLPDALNMSSGDFEREAKMAMAVKLFELGWVSSAEAARLAGMERVPFLLSLHRYGVAMSNLDEEELTQEFANARKAFSGHQ